MWFAQKLEEKAFIASAVGAVVMGYSTYEQTSRLMESMVSKIKTSQDPGIEFAKFIDILRSNTRLEDLAKKLDEGGGESCTLEYVYCPSILILVESVSR